MPLPDKATFDQKIEPFRLLRERAPGDLFVHMRYQDAVTANGVEGHLRAMQSEYLALRRKHPGEPTYLYLHGRALQGRVTGQAITTMEEVLAADPAFAQAHRTLVEIYMSSRFRDRVKEKIARAKFTALCPRAPLPPRPLPVPAQSQFASRMRELSKQTAEPEKVPELVYQAVQDEEWRLQRVRAFDWYTVEYKKQVAREAQSAHWKGSQILVRHYWRTHETTEALQLLTEMQERLERLQAPEDSTPYWNSAISLLDLYALTKQPEKARALLVQMEHSSAAKHSPKRAAELAAQKRRFSACASCRNS